MLGVVVAVAVEEGVGSASEFSVPLGGQEALFAEGAGPGNLGAVVEEITSQQAPPASWATAASTYASDQGFPTHRIDPPTRPKQYPNLEEVYTGSVRLATRNPYRGS